MPVSAVGTISGLYRYPVKGLTPERLQTVHVDRGATLPFDRAYAIENGPAKFDPAAPKYLPKVNFVMLMRNEQLASVRSYFDDASHTLTLSKDGREIARGNLQDAGGRSRIEAVVADLAGPSLRGAPRIVAAPGHSFSDVSAKCLHIVNLQSVRALEAAMGVAINPLRFRPNVIVDEWPAWSEFDLLGESLQAGNAMLSVFKRTERCAATNVDPSSGVRDLKIPLFLSRTYGHSGFGVYARVKSAGAITTGDHIGPAG